LVVYLVTTLKKLRNNFKEKIETGVNIEGYQTEPCKVKVLDDNLFSITLTEGKKHQIRRMCVALFQEVTDLKRVRIMNIKLGKMRPKEVRKMEGKELEDFLKETLKVHN
jgi:23S rRNA pseudouridine2604 synthase